MTKYLLSLLLLISVNLNATFERFFFKDAEGVVHEVEPHNVDKIIREIPEDKVEFAMKHLAIYSVKHDDGSYSLRAHGRILGGGAGGAFVGAVAGKAGTHIVCHGAISLIGWGIGFFCPPAGYAFVTGAEAVLSYPIEVLSNKVAIGTGLMLGVATGPA